VQPLTPEEEATLVPAARNLIPQQQQHLSAATVQRELGISRTKAKQVLNTMEQQGLVGPSQPGTGRVVQPAGGPPSGSAAPQRTPRVEPAAQPPQAPREDEPPWFKDGGVQ
jgi:biotin operon repressor